MIEIRGADVLDTDAQALLEAYFAARAASFPGGTYQPARPDSRAFAAPSGAFFVADLDRTAVGCVGVRRVGGERDARFEVKHLFVADTGRGRGIGQALMDAAESAAISHGADELVLDTHHTLTAAAGLYERCGFVAVARYNDNPNATVWLGKRLRSATDVRSTDEAVSR